MELVKHINYSSEDIFWFRSLRYIIPPKVYGENAIHSWLIHLIISPKESEHMLNLDRLIAINKLFEFIIVNILHKIAASHLGLFVLLKPLPIFHKCVL